jgi:hypothetical protein
MARSATKSRSSSRKASLEPELLELLELEARSRRR